MTAIKQEDRARHKAAEELTLADYHLFQPISTTGTDEDRNDDPDLDRRYQALAEINQALNTPL